MSFSNISFSLSNPHPKETDGIQKLGLAIAALGVLILFLAWFGINFPNPGLFLTLSLSMITVGTVVYARRTYLTQNPGIKNNGNWFSTMTNGGLWGWIFGIIITGFYIVLYFYPAYLGLGQDGAANRGMVALFDPLSYALKGQPASQWFLYGTLYTVSIFVMGIKFILKYRHNRYQVVRTISVMFFQTAFAFMIPELMEGLNSDLAANWFDKDMKNMWPLDYDFFDQWHIDNMTTSGAIGTSTFIFGLLMIFVISPMLTYYYGKRWYCSWVCGCGGLAETAGDPYRHLSDKSLSAWKLERWLIHSVLVLSLIMTIAVVYTYLGYDPNKYFITRDSFTAISVGVLLVAAALIYFLQGRYQGLRKNIVLLMSGIGILIAIVVGVNYIMGSSNAFFVDGNKIKSAYGFYIGAIFSGVIGVGFYPLLGSRVWCRFGCPMAAILGIQQRLFSRFRITTNGGQCISCGNCSTYCEMGIDVRSYAQKGQDVVRASCVGCGICAAVCPRGVLRLENGSNIAERTTELRTIHISEDQVKIL